MNGQERSGSGEDRAKMHEERGRAIAELEARLARDEARYEELLRNRNMTREDVARISAQFPPELKDRIRGRVEEMDREVRERAAMEMAALARREIAPSAAVEAARTRRGVIRL